jgi:hypothetical protein
MQRAAAFLLLLAAAARAEEAAGPIPGYALDTTVSAGYRLVDIDGSKAKYREDYNLRSGGRLFTFETGGHARAPETTRLDRFHLEIDTPGDEPVSHFRLSAADRTLYDLRASFTRSKYQYAVPQLFEAPVAGDVRLDDLHDFDLMRTDGVVDLTVRAEHLPTLLFGYRLYDRHGDVSWTPRIPNGDSFVVPAPIDSTTHVGRLGTEFNALSTDFFLQQEYRRIDRERDLRSDPGVDPGVDPTDLSTLTLYRRDENEHLDIPATTVRVRRPLGETAELNGAYLYSHADLDFDVFRQRRGTDDTGAPSPLTARGGGDATLDTQVADAGASVRVAERVELSASYRFDERTQNGSLDETSTFGRLVALTGDHVRVHSVTSEVQAEPRDDLSLQAGVRWAHRDAAFTTSAQDITSDAIGALAGARYRPWSFLDLHVRYENVQLEDPFTVPGDAAGTPPIPEREIALTFTNRGTAGTRITPWPWLALSYEFVADSRENANFAARSQTFANSGAITLTPLRDLTLFTSYTRRDLDNEANILLAPLYERTLSLQDGSEDVLVTTLRYDFALLGQRWSTGGDLAWVKADTILRPRLEPGLAGRKFFDLTRIDGGVFLSLHHRLVEPSVEFRRIDYNERVLPQNDYRATMLVFKLTRRWSF